MYWKEGLPEERGREPRREQKGEINTIGSVMLRNDPYGLYCWRVLGVAICTRRLLERQEKEVKENYRET